MITVTGATVQDVVLTACRQSNIDVTKWRGILGLELLQHTMSISNRLWPNAQEFAVSVVGVEHDYHSILELRYENESPNEPAFFENSRHAEFANAVLPHLGVPEDEVVRVLTIAWRMPDFALCVCSMEADGEFHDAISLPAFGHAIGTTVSVADIGVELVTELARRFWGKAWDPVRCHHNKRPPDGVTPMFMEMPDDDGH